MNPQHQRTQPASRPSTLAAGSLLRHMHRVVAAPECRQTSGRTSTWIERELTLLRLMHRATSYRGIETLFVAISKAADGAAWLLVIALLPWVSQMYGTPCATRMLGVGVANLIIYGALKRSVARPRPFVVCSDIRACTRALDRYSFPSGHTMHAVAFTVVLAAYFPIAATAAGCFAVLIAVSRLVLGLHYPTDVAIGGLIGGLTASVMFCLF
jgi:undecaprenyl-diphosphatase